MGKSSSLSTNTGYDSGRMIYYMCTGIFQLFALHHY